MSHRYSPSISQAACTILMIGLPCFAQLPSPVRELAKSAESAVGGSRFTEIPISSADFKTAALVSVKTDLNGSRTAVDRSANALSAVYAGASLPNALSTPATPALSAAPPTSQRFDFKQSGDSAQGWATMSATGLPFLMTRAFGKATASGTTAWMARVFVPNSEQNTMYVRFTLPQIQVMGTTEVDGPSRYQARFRAELLLNGHPVWSSEAIRLNEFFGNPGICHTADSDVHESSKLLQTYGAVPAGLSATDPSDWSSENTVTLTLGSFPAGQALDVSLVVRADTSVDHQCCHNDNGYFCTGATSVVDWDNTVTTPVRFWAGPVI